MEHGEADVLTFLMCVMVDTVASMDGMWWLLVIAMILDAYIAKKLIDM